MALNFPSSPSVGDIYQRWTWNGIGWAPTVTAAQPMLPIAGGNITGNLGVAGTTTLTGTLTALGHSQINTLDVNAAANFNDTLDVAGQATFADGVEIDGVDAADFATKTYVDEAVASGGLWQGTWDASTNTPDLTQTTLQRNGWGWTVVTPDPTAPFDVPATPAIPGVSGTTVYNGDHVIWSDAASTFEHVSGSSISRQEAEDLFPLKQDALIRGVPGTYNQVAGTPATDFEFNDFQTFLDANINNRWFDGNLTINLDIPNTNSVAMSNIFASRRLAFRINASEQIASDLNLTHIHGWAYVDIFCTAPVACTGCICDTVSVRFGGSTTYSGTTVFQGACYVIFGMTPTDDLYFPAMSTSAATMTVISSNNPILTIDTLTNNGRFDITSPGTNLTLTTLAGQSRGFIVDNRAGRPLDTFLRWPATAIYTGAGTYTYVAPKTGIYEILAIGPGGAGTAWIGNPPFGTTGSPPKFNGGVSGQSARKQVTLPRGYQVTVTVGAAGTQTDATYNGSGQGMGWLQAVGGDTFVGGTTGGDNDVAISPLQWHTREVVACGGFSGWSTGNKWAGQSVVQNGANGTATLGGTARGLAGVSWAGPTYLSAGRGGDPGAAGQDGAVSIAYVSPA